MHVVAFTGYSGAGKTTLLERVIPALRARGLRVSVIKHAHHGFDMDRPGKDTWRHRQAGAHEVLVVSGQRLALLRELDPAEPVPVSALVAELDGSVDWVLIEGFRGSDLPKVEVWRADTGHAAHYPDDARITAVATDDPARLPLATTLPVLPINDPLAVAGWLLDNGALFAWA